jgi:hypothetical protein
MRILKTFEKKGDSKIEEPIEDLIREAGLDASERTY